MSNQSNFLSKLKSSGTNWKYILIVAILAVIVGGGILTWQWWKAREEVKIAKEIAPEEEITNYPIFSIEEYGFSMRIHPNFIKKEEEEKGGYKRIVFSKDKETITIAIDKSENVKTHRAILLDILKLKPEEYKEITEFALDAEFISTKNIEKDACVGKWDQYLEKESGKHIQSLVLTSLNLENMHITIFFGYYTKEAESNIFKMIETIKCNK